MLRGERESEEALLPEMTAFLPNPTYRYGAAEGRSAPGGSARRPAGPGLPPSSHSWYTASAFTAFSRSKGHFISLWDSLKKSPADSMTRVSLTGHWRFSGLWAPLPGDEVRHVLWRQSALSWIVLHAGCSEKPYSILTAVCLIFLGRWF